MFLAVFVVVLLITIAYPALPPGLTIYHMMGLPDTDYRILGLAAPTFAAAILNGVIYGTIVWLINSIAARGKKRRIERKLQSGETSELFFSSPPFFNAFSIQIIFK